MNIFKNKKFIATALTIVIFMAVVQPPLLTAKERRGATVVVTMTDGNQVKGELLAVKSDALLVYDHDAGQGKSIDLQQVVRVKILKKSKFGEGILIGMGVGVGIGLGIGLFEYLQLPDSENDGLAGLTIVYRMPITGLIGGIIGGVAGIIPKKLSLAVAGISSQSRQQNLERLKRYAREQD